MSHAGHGGGGSGGGSEPMVMTFHNGQTTPLFTTTWAPASSGAYAGTIVFLIVLGIVHRALVAHKAIQERVWLARDAQRRIIVDADSSNNSPDTAAAPATAEKRTELGKEDGVVTESTSSGSSIASGSNAGTATPDAGARDAARRSKEDELSRRKGWKRAWRWSVDLPRAALTTLVSGVGYLLMLAVMTMNVGYFFAVLAGLFVGELAFGRFIGMSEH